MIARIRAAALACLSALALQAAAGAPAAHAAYPEQAIKLVVPFTPGGATDAVARLLANRLSGKLGQAVIVENRPGASTVIGANAVAQAQPDGYTLMLSGSTTYTVLPALKRDLPYDPRRSFEHIAIVALAPVVLLAQNSVPAKTAQQAAELARDKTASGGLMYGTFGPGSAPHLVGEMFAEAAGAKMTPVPYKGSAQFITALIGGEIALGVDTVSSAAPQVKAGKVRALAVTGEHRVPQLPDVPTFIESGLPGVSMVGWYGLVAPARTPQPVLDTLNRAVAGIMADPQVQRAVTDLALEPVHLDGAAFTARMRQELQTFGEVGRRANIKLD
ncbi:Bug family tripartite tricarboxylate transporter substrate binding protein [Achromobacter ruhlandii]|uniref:Bug family tripartite tricarboxylate transporter substrate binding protein n=1 Tax=Achromobacter ruhlandii TaxID=72557 RepID=UPI001EEF1B76|nr:tripartite tricarboxylate transporter substrate binding protein [Achromobacter ruhlandii]MCZ8397563.1 tripartite tricarboxylate transporter substrate binding protein [Achromobacter ruhlandii]